MPRNCAVCGHEVTDPLPWVQSGLSAVWHACSQCLPEARVRAATGKLPWEFSLSAMGPRHAS